MTSSELKLKAKERLMGKKKNAAIVIFVMMLILMVVSGVLSAIFPGKTELKDIGGIKYTYTQSNPIVSIISLVFSTFLYFGFYSYCMKIARGEDPELNELFSKGNLVIKGVVTVFIVSILEVLGLICLVIPGIIIACAYSMVYFIYLDNPEIGITEVMTKSRHMMKGHKWDYFCLMLSFIGWFILSIFTLGILLLWLVPYMTVTIASFYDSIRGVEEVKEVEEEKIEETTGSNE